MGKSAGAPPAAPDYQGAAETTAKSQQVSQYTPYGSLVYSPDSASPAGVKATTTLDPNITKATDALLPQVAQQYSQPMNLSSVNDIYNKSYDTQTARLDPQWDARSEQNRTMLANQGLAPGGEAYTNAMRDFNNARNDAYSQARQNAISTMPQTYDLASAAYSQPLNTLNALRTGAPMSSGLSPTNYLGAAQAGGQYAGDIYNQQVASANAANSGLYGLGTAGLIFASDRRLKRNIVPLDNTYFGYPLYRFSYIWEDDSAESHVGVMADEVVEHQPEAVFDIDGFMVVDYGALHGH